MEGNKFAFPPPNTHLDVLGKSWTHLPRKTPNALACALLRSTPHFVQQNEAFKSCFFEKKRVFHRVSTRFPHSFHITRHLLNTQAPDLLLWQQSCVSLAADFHLFLRLLIQFCALSATFLYSCPRTLAGSSVSRLISRVLVKPAALLPSTPQIEQFYCFLR